MWCFDDVLGWIAKLVKFEFSLEKIEFSYISVKKTQKRIFEKIDFLKSNGAKRGLKKDKKLVDSFLSIHFKEIELN